MLKAENLSSKQPKFSKHISKDPKESLTSYIGKTPYERTTPELVDYLNCCSSLNKISVDNMTAEQHRQYHLKRKAAIDSFKITDSEFDLLITLRAAPSLAREMCRLLNANFDFMDCLKLEVQRISNEQA